MATKRKSGKGSVPSEPSFLEQFRVAFERPAGYTDVYAIVGAYDAGKPLPSESLDRLVNAMRVFLSDGTTDANLQEFAKLAGLRGKQGRRQPTARETERREQMVLEVFLEERQLAGEGVKSRAARAEATRLVAGRRHSSLRALQENIRLFGESARQLVAMLDYAEKFRAEQAGIAQRFVAKQEAVMRQMATTLKTRAGRADKS